MFSGQSLIRFGKKAIPIDPDAEDEISKTLLGQMYQQL